MLDRVMLVKDNMKADPELLADARSIYEISILLDFYGQLLTARQFEILDMHCNSDYSLGEIAEELGISRQGVHDGVRKGKEALLSYEERLGLAARFKTQEEGMKKALESLGRAGFEVPGIRENKNFIEAVETLSRVMESL